MISKYSNHKLCDFRIGDKVKVKKNALLFVQNANVVGTVIEIGDKYILIKIKWFNSISQQETFFYPNQLILQRLIDKNIICKKSK